VVGRVTVDLGLFTAAELRAGGINSRGFLQPLLPPPEGGDHGPADHDAAGGLASRGLLRRGQSGWRPVGRYERVLEAAAVARSLVAVWPADPRDTGFNTPRLALGCLGVTDWVLDLRPEPPGYHARLVETPVAAAEVTGHIGQLAGWAPGVPDEPPPDRNTPREPAARGSGQVPGAPDRARPISDHDSGWSNVDRLLRRGVASVRIEAASISQPAGPLSQHRLTVVSTDEGDWLLIGTREGERAARWAAPAAGLPLGQVLEDLLRGLAIAL
jgi:hypothetical protein